MGQLIHWEHRHDYLILKLRAKRRTGNIGYYSTGAVELGSDFGGPINSALTEAIAEPKAKKSPIRF